MRENPTRTRKAESRLFDVSTDFTFKTYADLPRLNFDQCAEHEHWAHFRDSAVVRVVARTDSCLCMRVICVCVVHACVYVFVCMNVCTYVCMHACMCVRVYFNVLRVQHAHSSCSINLDLEP